ncbi:hypothetical protein L837_5178 [Mycobacterium avium MAV_061107_1842]|nr:hypothetical protein L837_5178 [Mycobacterium avium MAV_061107_1842]
MASTAQTRSPGTSLDQVRDALHAAGHVIRPRGEQAFMASCPLHTDHSPHCRWDGETTPAAGAAGGAAALL